MFEFAEINFLRDWKKQWNEQLLEQTSFKTATVLHGYFPRRGTKLQLLASKHYPAPID